MSALPGVHQPDDLRALPAAALPELAGEIRALLVETVSRTGGHLGSNLGVVELTIALHRVFRSPRDAIVFDGGHQSYVHKILTGRRGDFPLLRQAGGLSGYPSRAESPHDLVANSHASTGLSYVDGLARAAALRPTGGIAVAVVGDGALAGGMAWEALNSIAAGRRPVVVVLNDNGRACGPTALGEHLARLRDGGFRLSVFEAIGLAYVGPVDGHDLDQLEAALGKARSLGRPVVVHCLTTKGKGYPPAEEGCADRLPAAGDDGPTWASVFGAELVELGRSRPDLVCVTAGSTGLDAFAAAFPDRVVDVGAAEQHAVACAAGLAMGGLHPVVALRSAVLGRALDQVLFDVALHALPVTFALGRAGVAGADGPSQHGMWDLPMLHCVPGLRVAAPRDARQLRRLLARAVGDNGPTALRLPCGTPGPDLPELYEVDGVGVLHEAAGRDVLLVAIGPMAVTAVRAALKLAEHGVGATVCDPGWAIPPHPALVDLAATHRMVVSVEDGARVGGAGTRLAQAIVCAGVATPAHPLGLPADFLPQGTRAEILRGHRLDAPGLTRTILALLDRAAPRESARPAR
ncbi:1-deoxy-D-xylulose-5-phosphate synthase [Actinokineospora sp. NPDC004072]